MSYKINYSAEEKIKLAKDDSVDKLYESKKNQRTVRVLTVCAYMLTVSMAAIILSLYYVFLWDPRDASAKNAQNPNARCEKLIIPELIAIRLANDSEVSAETFFEDILKQIQKMHAEILRTVPKDQPKMNRSEVNNYLQTKYQRDAPFYPKQSKMVSKKKYPDDEDFNSDTESSGDKIATTMFPTPAPDPLADMNDTTIIFDSQDD